MAVQIPCEDKRRGSPFRARLRPRAFPHTHIPEATERLQDIDWKLRETEIRYRDLLDNQEDVILRCDSQGRITFVNAAVCNTFAIAPDTVIGTKFVPPIISGHRPPPLTPTSPSRRQRFTLELRTTAGPRRFDFEEHIVPALDDAEFETQFVGRDITEQYRQEMDLAEARDQAEAANRAKSRFLAAMSHEIRTPMNGILGMGTLLKDTVLTADQTTYVNAIDRSARTLLALIDEILDFSKIEAGKLALEARTFNLEDCVQSVVELLAPRASEKGIELAWAIDPSLPEMLLGDENRVRQIVTNLVGNAVKFTDQGGVLVTVGTERHVDTSDADRLPQPALSKSIRLAISVQDTGIGIKPDAYSTLFAEFEQGDPATHRQHGGTGLGLAISRRLARAMDGDILLKSVPGSGSRFTALLSLQRVRASRALRFPGVEQRAVHVLLAGLQPMAEAALRLTFEGAHVPVEAARLDRAGIAIAAAAHLDAPFTVLVVDGTSPLATARKLLGAAKHAATGQSVRGIVSFSAHNRTAYDLFRNAGFSGYLLRPVRPSSLLAQALGLASDLRRPRAERQPLPADLAGIAPDDRKRLDVLLAEDNEINALVARRMLEHSDCRVTHVLNGRDAVAAVTTADFDLVLMDMHMPVMDGIDATRAIDAHFKALETSTGTEHAPRRARPRIVALTANAFAEDRQRCLDAGMDDYLAKPFERTDFEALLERLR